MPRIIPPAVRTDEGYAWPVQPRLRMSIGLVAKSLALAHGRPGGRLIGKENVRPAVMDLIERRVTDPSRPEQEVPADVLAEWGRWLVERGIFPAEAVDESPDLE